MKLDNIKINKENKAGGRNILLRIKYKLLNLF